MSCLLPDFFQDLLVLRLDPGRLNQILPQNSKSRDMAFSHLLYVNLFSVYTVDEVKRKHVICQKSCPIYQWKLEEASTTRVIFGRVQVLYSCILYPFTAYLLL